MSDHIYRVIARGQFENLEENTRAALLAVVDKHDLLNAQFSDEGTLTYDRALRSFTFRCAVRAAADGDGPDEAAMLGEDKAAATLRAMGCGFRDLRTTSTDMEKVKVRRR